MSNWSRKFNEAEEVSGYDLAEGDVTVDMFGNLYLIVAAAFRPEGSDVDVVERKDLDADGNPTDSVFTYMVDADSNFAKVAS